MKVKLSTYALISLLAGVATQATGQSQSEPREENEGTLDCEGSTCTDADGLLFRLRTRSYSETVTQGTNRHSSSEALQPDRRATVVLEPPGKATVAGKFSVALPDGGVIWATEDPDLGQPELSISAHSFVAFDRGRILEPVQFFIRSNYSAFVDHYEIALYRDSDADLIEPIATLRASVAALGEISWSGELPDAHAWRAGDELVYVLRAYADDGTFDETFPKRIQLVAPQDAERSRRALHAAARGTSAVGLSVQEAVKNSLLNSVFADSGLRQQNIPVRGSRVRIRGRDIPNNLALTINGEDYPLDYERKFVAEYLLPIGRHGFDIGVADTSREGVPDAHHLLEVDVTGRYFFATGLADVTLSGSSVSGSTALFANDSRRQDDFISDGRLAFYGKAKLRGKYLITAHADTTERDLERLFDDFGDAYPSDVFRRLDPDLYYPTYGDDSTVYRDVDTMGRFYVRVDWDKNQALWGNYATGLVGTEYAQYVRSLYGAALDWRSQETNAWGDARTELRAFGSQAETAPGHNELVGTGGSLYYLRHTDILPGSDSVVLETRDPTTGRVEGRIALQRGTDYEIDELQGRILLTRPLAQFTRQNVVTLTRDTPLDGLEQRLVVDYEWVPSAFDSDQLTGGLRTKTWLSDHLGVGVTYVDENRAGEDYTIAGTDLTLQAGKGTYLKAEYVQTDSFSSPVFFSDNGGFTFAQLAVQGAREGSAKSVETRANLKELGWTNENWTAAAWWREVDDGYSLNRYPTGQAVEEQGAEILGDLTIALSLYTRFSTAERGADTLDQAQTTLEWRLDEANSLSGEIRRVQQSDAVVDAAGVLGAMRYTHRFGTSLDLYGQAQLTLDHDEAYADNDAFTVGSRYLYGDRASLAAELTTGDRGDAAQLGGEFRLSPEHTLYGAYTLSTDTTESHSLFNPGRLNGWTMGQRRRLSHQVNVFNESQSLKEPDQSGLAHTFGMDFYPAQGWNLGFTVQSGELESSAGLVDRRAMSVSAGRSSPDSEWRSKIERRRDTGVEQREQWVTTNRLTHRINESWRIAARFNYAKTDDELDPQAGAQLIEGNVGFAFRPWNSTRWGLFGRYTYMYDLASLGQAGGAQVDQRSHVVSFEGVYAPARSWEYAVKLARREGDVRMGRGQGEWFDSATTFSAAQVRYELRAQWHALAEYRWLDVDDGGTSHGWLVGLDRDITDYLRIGAGYNFTDFSDDLTNFDYRHRGWFINLVASY